MMKYTAWYDTTRGKLLLSYDTGNGNVEKRKQNFLTAVAEAERVTGCRFCLNDDGRRLVDELKTQLQVDKPSLFQSRG